jgi:hypothetical protein
MACCAASAPVAVSTIPAILRRVAGQSVRYGAHMLRTRLNVGSWRGATGIEPVAHTMLTKWPLLRTTSKAIAHSFENQSVVFLHALDSIGKINDRSGSVADTATTSADVCFTPDKQTSRSSVGESV